MKRPEKRRLKLKTYNVVMEAIETGIAWGLSRAYKYEEKPSRETIIEHVRLEIVNALEDVVEW